MNLELIVKDPLVRGALALYPVYSPSPAAPAYLTGPEAERMGVLRVSEKRGGATVPELAVHNTGALPLLLLEGETLVGVKQNRTLDISVLVPAGATIHAPVSCVEAGRWGAPRASSRSVRHSPQDLRRVKASTLADPERRASKQAAVWDRIEEYHHALSTASPTGALEDAFAGRASDVTNLVLGTRPLPDQRGVIVAVGDTIRGVDVFDKPTTLAVYWDGLCAGYALDAIGTRAATSHPSVNEAQTFAARVVQAELTDEHPAGLGTTATILADGIVGHVLAWDDTPVHVAVFVDETGAGTPPRSVLPIRRRPRGGSS